jgi:hypothetical protein
VSEDRKLPIVPIALAVGVGVVAVMLGLRWLDRAGVDSPRRKLAEKAKVRETRSALRAAGRDTGDVAVRIADKANPLKNLQRSADRTDRVMDDLAASGRPVVRCALAEPLPGGKARRPQVLDVVGQPEGAHLLAFANTDAIYMSLPERAAGSAVLAPEGFLPIEISWKAPREGEAAPCSPEPLFFEPGGSGIAGVVFAGDTPAPDALVVATCGDEIIEGGTDAAGEFYLPAPPGPCRVDAIRGAGDDELVSPPIDVEVPEDDDAVIELVLPTAPAAPARALRAVPKGVEVTEVDDVMTELGIHAGDTILKVGEHDAHDLDAAEVDALLDRAATGELSVMWMTPDGQITAQRLAP